MKGCLITAMILNGRIIIGAYDCNSEFYVAQAEKNAKAIGCKLGYVNGSNIILEKLVSGNWDEQFYIGNPNTCVEGVENHRRSSKFFQINLPVL